MAIILGWDQGPQARLVPLFRDARAAIEAEGRGRTPWPAGSDSLLRPGVRVHLMLQGEVRGIVGCGRVATAASPSSPDAPAGPALALALAHVTVDWEALLPEEELITVAELEARVPGVDWARCHTPLTALDEVGAAQLERVWLAPHPASRPGRLRHCAADRLARLLSREQAALAQAATPRPVRAG